MPVSSFLKSVYIDSFLNLYGLSGDLWPGSQQTREQDTSTVERLCQHSTRKLAWDSLLIINLNQSNIYTVSNKLIFESEDIRHLNDHRCFSIHLCLHKFEGWETWSPKSKYLKCSGMISYLYLPWEKIHKRCCSMEGNNDFEVWQVL